MNGSQYSIVIDRPTATTAPTTVPSTAFVAAAVIRRARHGVAVLSPAAQLLRRREFCFLRSTACPRTIPRATTDTAMTATNTPTTSGVATT